MHDPDQLPLLPSSDAARGAPRASRLGQRTAGNSNSDPRSAAASRIQRRVRLFLDARRRQRAATRILRALRAFTRRRRLGVTRPAGAPVLGSGLQQRLWVALLIAAWYTLSVLLGLFNKRLLDAGRGHFPAPLLLTGVQFGFQSAFVAGLLATPALRHLRPPPLPTRDWANRVVPVGLAAAGDVGASNMSLVYISLSFYTMCKSVTPLYLLAFAVALRLEPMSWSLTGSVALIVSGVACAVGGEEHFNGTGFSLVMAAAALSGLRWALTQRLMAGHGAQGLGHPLGVMSHVLPVMAAASCACSLLLERPWAALPASSYFATTAAGAQTTCLVALAAVMAFGMTAAEFILVRATSAVTLSVAGTVKEALSVLVFTLVDGDSLGPLNAVGLLLLCAGVLGYNLTRRSHSGGVAPPKREGGRELQQLLTSSSHGADPEAGREGAVSPRLRGVSSTGKGNAATGRSPEDEYMAILSALLPDKGR